MKIFISYCHKNKDEVYKIVDCMEERGLDVWIDKKQIDKIQVGIDDDILSSNNALPEGGILSNDDILSKINDSINECDLHLVLLSKYTKNAAQASHELQTLFSRIINSKNDTKKWFLVKLDDVDPEDIIAGLGGYMYFDMQHNSMDELIERISKKLDALWQFQLV